MSVSFPFGFELGCVDLIVLIPDQCLSISFQWRHTLNFISKKSVTRKIRYLIYNHIITQPFITKRNTPESLGTRY